MDQISSHHDKKNTAPPVYIVDGLRTPFLKSTGQPGDYSAADLAVHAARSLLVKMPFSPDQIDELILGCVNPGVDEANIARIVALRLGCQDHTPAMTVQRNCASGLQALDTAVASIQQGRSSIVLAGGTEAMSHAPLLYNPKMLRWFAAWMRAKSPQQKLAHFSRLSLGALFSPVVALMRGLTDPLSGWTMGQTAEELADRFGIDRAAMDHFAVESHRRADRARDALSEAIIPLFAKRAQVLCSDTGVRADASFEKLQSLKPIFDKKYGQVTPGNSSQVTDGAAMLVLASEAAVHTHKLPVLGKVVGTHWAALDPDIMGLGPVMATVPLLQQHHLMQEDIDYWEINEAFAGQVLACQAAFEDEHFCQQHFGLAKAFGAIDPQRLNVTGGAIALGHPVGASGARIVLELLKTLQRQGAQRGVASLCIGGGQGGAMVLENMAAKG